MFGSLHKKLMLIMLLLITSLMVVTGTFLTARVTSFYINSFYQQIDSVFGVDQREFVLDLRRAAAESNGAEHLREMLEANAGPLGIDYRTRNYFILDGMTGDYLTGSAGADALPREQSPNLLTARLAVAQGNSVAVGEDSYFAAGYMDAAIPILPIAPPYDSEGLIIYILDNQEILSGLNRELLPIILQALAVRLLIAALISFLLAKAMARPLERLTVSVEEVAAGTFGRALPVESNDEIGILTGTFNEMAGVLHDTLAAVENERNKLDTLFLHIQVATDGERAYRRGRHTCGKRAAWDMKLTPAVSMRNCSEIHRHSGKFSPFSVLITLKKNLPPVKKRWNFCLHRFPTVNSAVLWPLSTTLPNTTAMRNAAVNLSPTFPMN